MAHAQIISSVSGDPIYTGPPKYVGTYRKPGYIEFREIAAPSPIEWHAGDYVDYARTGKRYKLYRTPQQIKQAGTLRYGAAFVYENVQFFDGSKDLEYCQFIDLVPQDNSVHFSTVDTFSFWGNVYRVAERLEACMEYWRPSDTWTINVVSGLTDPAFDTLNELLNSYQDFSASGLSCLDVLDKIYDMWGVGWSYDVVNGENVITIGAPNVLSSANTTKSFYYGRGLTRLKRSVSNADEIGTRLYAYGSTRNMYSTYYRNKTIKDAASVNIAHLMIPISQWGTDDLDPDLPDASKAFLQNDTAVSLMGLIPKYVYYDGTDSKYPEIFPSVSQHTIGELRAAMEELQEEDFVPDENIWDDSDRIDVIVTGDNTNDDGRLDHDGDEYISMNQDAFAAETVSFNIAAGDTTEYPFYRYESWEFTASGEKRIQYKVNFNNLAIPNTAGFSAINVELSIQEDNNGGHIHQMFQCAYQNQYWRFPSDVQVELISTDTEFTFELEIYLIPAAGAARSFSFNFPAAPYTIGLLPTYPDTFTLVIPQIGFDINARAVLGNGKTISMKSGDCAGREFKIKSCSWDNVHDTWNLTCLRFEDESLNTLFPNSTYHIAADDEYVLLDIAMPDTYIEMASQRLYTTALAHLAEIDHEVHMYELEIDAKLVFNDNRTLREGMYMHLTRDEIVDNGSDYVLIENIEIDEGGSNIPTYSIRLMREKYWSIPIQSCFGSGKWISDYPWIGTDTWKNNE